MSVAKHGAKGIITLKIPAGNRDAWEFFGAVASILISQYVDLALVLSTRRVFTQKFRRIVALAAIFPDDRKLAADQLNVFGLHALSLVKTGFFQLLHQFDRRAFSIKNVEVDAGGAAFK